MVSAGKIARRTFLFGAAALAGGVAFGYYKYNQPFENPLLTRLSDGEASFNAYIKIAADNRITVVVPRAEMGQGVSTTLAALVAEELDVRLDQISVEHGPASPAYYNRAALAESAPVPRFDDGMLAETLRGSIGVLAKFLALQFTGGSSSTIDAFEPMRQAGAMAREMLKAAAASRWNADIARLTTMDATVRDDASGKVLTYGELAADAARLAPPADVVLRARSQWKILGKPQPRKDMVAKVTGAPVYGIDVDLPDMLHATIRMCPYPGGRMARFDKTAASQLRGVADIIEIDSPYGHGFGVMADNTWRAFQAADAVEVEWERPASHVDSAGMEKLLDTALQEGSDRFHLRTLGDPDRHIADAAAADLVEARYSVPHLAHATMEPMNATAQFSDGRLTIWSPNQSPSVIEMIARRITGLERDRIDIRTTMMGGGFGRRIEPDFSDYAIRLAMAAKGRPVQVTWSREEDMSHSVYRPAARGLYRARLSGDGSPVAVSATIASQSVVAGMAGRIAPAVPIGGPDNTMLDGAYNQPYAFAHHRADAVRVQLPVPVGSWRSVGYSFNAFMLESFLDEIAEARKLDPLDLRISLLGENPAAAGVLRKVAEMSGWKTPPAEGRARGLAYCLSFGTHVAQVVEVSGSPDAIRIEQIWCAADPGLVLDPGIFRAQLMSAINYGLSAAMFQAITVGEDGVEQLNFSDYDCVRMNTAPPIDIALLETSPFMGGAGEPGTPPSMPALASAVSRLTGKRIRDLPLSKSVTFA